MTKKHRVSLVNAFIFALATSSFSRADINIPLVDPFFVLSGKQTLVTITIFIPNQDLVPNSVNLLRLDTSDRDLTILGALNDGGIAGDKKAGDHVFTIIVNLEENRDRIAKFRIAAEFKGARKKTVATITIPVIKIPQIQDFGQYNQTVDNVFFNLSKGRDLFKPLNNSPISSRKLSNRLKKITENLLLVQIELQAIYNFETHSPSNLPRILDYLPIFGSLVKKSRSAVDEQEIFIGDGTDPRAKAIADWAVTTGCLDQSDLSGEATKGIRVDCVELYETSNPASSYIQTTTEAKKVIIKEELGQFTDLIGRGVSGITDVLGTSYGFLIEKGVTKTIDKIIDIFIVKDTNAMVLAAIEVQDGETLQLPTGSHDLLFSFGSNTPRAISRNIPITLNSSSTASITPGDILVLPETPPVRYLKLVQGNPGVSGDGIFVNVQGGIDPFSPADFELFSPIPLMDTPDGFTLTVFLKNKPVVTSNGFATILSVLNRSDCTFGIVNEALETLGPIINGVQGYAIIFSRQTLENNLANIKLDPNFKCKDSILDDYFLSSFNAFDNSQAGGIAKDLDAVAFGLGENAFPNNQTPSP